MINAPYSVRPIDVWPGERTRPSDRQWSRFRASNTDTLQRLGRELAYLEARNILLQLDVREKDIRLDGALRANARPASPGVILAFQSNAGPLKFAVDTFSDAWDNLRAIALGMEALRKVDRYGITKRGEQYTGWKQLPSSASRPASSMDPDTAARTLWTIAFPNQEPADRDIHSVLTASNFRTTTIRRALHASHPDHGGSDGTFQLVQKCREVLATVETVS